VTEKGKNAGESPYATGGGGGTLENRVTARYLALLLRGGTGDELDGGEVVSVSFQQAPKVPTDDVVIVARRRGEATPSLRLAVAVRRIPQFVPSNEDAEKLVRDFIRTLRLTDEPYETAVALVAAGDQRHAKQIAELANHAKTQANAELFFTEIQTRGRHSQDLRDRLAALTQIVAKALTTIEGTPPEAAQLRIETWRLLVRLSVVMPRVESPDESDWVRTQNDLMSIARGRDLAGAERLRDRLESLAADYRKTAGTIDLSLLRRDAHAFLDNETYRNREGWEKLRRRERQARDAVHDTVGPSPNGVRIDRSALAAAIAAAVRDHDLVVVTGDSGVGKSALVVTVVSDLASREPAAVQALVLNLRQLPATAGELEHDLGAPLEQLIGEMSAPLRVLVVDAAEVAAERDTPVFNHLVAAARAAGVHVVAVASTDVVEVVRRFMQGHGQVAQQVVKALTDEEITMVASRFPGLSRMAQDARSREVLRRLVAIDLLLRAGITDTPLSDAETMRTIWNGVVRNRAHGRGLPDARDQVLLQIAQLHLRGRRLDELVGKLDPEALDGLQHDGVLQRASEWQPIPDFAHDELRRYAVARALLAERAPAHELDDVVAPRWALGASRLAAEVLLEETDSPRNPLRGRLARMQAEFDALAAKFGKRWADVPTEALLTVANPRPVLSDAWLELKDKDPEDLERLLRVIEQRHARDGLVDRTIVEPVIELLLDEPRPWSRRSSEKVLRGWLRTLLVEGAAAGGRLRIRLRELIVAACADDDKALADQREAAERARAARTPQQIEEEKKRRERWEPMLGEIGYPRSRRRRPNGAIPHELTDDTLVELLALLGVDIGAEGERLLRRVGEAQPWSLAPALEEPLTGRGLAEYGHDLVASLAESYYIDEDEDGTSWLEDGIRDHHTRGMITPLFAWYRGPFMPLLQSDFQGGVAVIQRMLNHGAVARTNAIARLTTPFAGLADPSGAAVELRITGSPRNYVGDDQVWRWYRGTGTGPYPCMSALLALERVCDQLIEAGLPLDRLVPFLLKDCNNLAMPGFVVGVLVRHLDKAGKLLDPFLADPRIWHLEFARAASELSGLAASSEGVDRADRRQWTLREAAMVLTVNAEGDRVAELRAIGEELVRTAEKLVVASAETQDASAQETGTQTNEAASDAIARAVAEVRAWARALDRDSYTATEKDGVIYAEIAVPADIEAALRPRTEDLARAQEEIRLQQRYLPVGARTAADATPDQLSADLKIALDLVTLPPELSASYPFDAPAAVAAVVLRAHVFRGIAVRDDDVTAAAHLLVEVAERTAPRSLLESEESFFERGADRTAAFALPLLLLPDTRNARDEVTQQRVLSALRRLARAVPNETRLYLGRGFDAIWDAPCAGTPCHHQLAFDLVVESMRDSALGPWDTSGRRDRQDIGDPVVDMLDAIDGKDLYPARFDGAIRAAGAVIGRATCVNDRARKLLRAMLAAQRRALLAYERSIDHRGSHTLVAARALLQLAAAGDDGPLHEHVAAYADRPDLLEVLLHSYAAAAEEAAALADAARRVWPTVIGQLLELEKAGREPFTGDSYAAGALAALMPGPTYESAFLYREVADGPIFWPDIGAWQAALDAWTVRARGVGECVGAAVALVHALPVADQIRVGLPWVSDLALTDTNNARKNGLVSVWLIELRPHLTKQSDIDVWQRLVDALVVEGDTELAPYSR
jgi:hypothetical protein